jgi:hypothetical protein
MSKADETKALREQLAEMEGIGADLLQAIRLVRSHVPEGTRRNVLDEAVAQAFAFKKEWWSKFKRKEPPDDAA